MRQKIKDYLSKPTHVVMVIEFILIFILNLLVVTTSDDLGYQIQSGLIDIFKREYRRYFLYLRLY